jgi:arsenate reductase (thioredoxin)
MSNGHYNVLFLSNRNTVRSIFAEAVMKRIGREHFTGFSAGMRPADQLDPLARDVLRAKQYPTDGLYPKHWRQFARPNALPLDFVFALSERQEFDSLPGRREGRGDRYGPQGAEGGNATG